MSEWSKKRFKACLVVVHLLPIIFITIGFYLHLYLGIFAVIVAIIGLLYIWFKMIDLLFELKEKIDSLAVEGEGK